MIHHPSPNYGPRRDGARPDLIVLHYTAMAGAQAALERLCDPVYEVSAHYLVGGDGTVWQMVDEEMRAWHAGAGQWGAVCDVNSRSIGIELDNLGDHPFAAPQMDALDQLLAAIMRRWAIPPERVIGHSDMAPTRKIDPGPRFDWLRLARQGLSVWPDEETGDPAQFRADAARFGYTADVPDDEVLTAFRMRFRPWATGPVCAADAGAARALARRYPVDQTGLNA